MLARSPSVPAGVALDVPAGKGCSASVAGSPTRVVAAPTAFSPFLTDSVTVPVLLPRGSGSSPSSVATVAAMPLDRGHLGNWLKDIGVTADVDLAVACLDGKTASTASGPRDGQMRALALSRLSGGSASLPGARSRSQPPAPGTPAWSSPQRPRVAGVAAPSLLFSVLGLALALGAVMVWWLARQLTMPVVAVTWQPSRRPRVTCPCACPSCAPTRVGRLAQSLQPHGGEIEGQLTEIKHSHDLLTDNVQRLGDALQRTHDLDGLLATVCAISASTTESVRATAWLVEGAL